MNKYFGILNWLLLLAVLAVAKWLAPLLGGWLLTGGAVVGCMFTVGLTAWQFHRDKSPDKDWKWRKGYFHKEYGIDVMVWLMGTIFNAMLGCQVWSGFYFFTGFCTIWLVNILIEYLWAKIHHYGKKK